MFGVQRKLLARTVLLANCFAIILKSSFGEISSAPLNRVVYEGTTNTTITCESNDTTLDWLVIPFNGPSGASILTTNGALNPPFNESYAINHAPGTDVYTLVVFNATISLDRANISTVGIYQCYNSDTGSAVAAQLVVIRTDPVCSSNFTQSTVQSGDTVQLSCTIVYGAARRYPIDAVISWSVNGQTIPATDSTLTISATQTEITATSTRIVNRNPDDVDATYECGTTFSQPNGNPPPGIATNAPDFFKTCSISLRQPTTAPPTTTADNQTTTSQQVTTTANVDVAAVTALLSVILAILCLSSIVFITAIVSRFFFFSRPKSKPRRQRVVACSTVLRPVCLGNRVWRPPTCTCSHLN